jgi:hypothetical protein
MFLCSINFSVPHVIDHMRITVFIISPFNSIPCVIHHALLGVVSEINQIIFYFICKKSLVFAYLIFSFRMNKLPKYHPYNLYVFSICKRYTESVMVWYSILNEPMPFSTCTRMVLLYLRLLTYLCIMYSLY